MVIVILPNGLHSIKLAYPNIKGFSDRNLKRMKYIYNEYKDTEKWQQHVAKLPWGHNVLLFEKIKDMDTRLKYIEGCIQNGWSSIYGKIRNIERCTVYMFFNLNKRLYIV